jgi:hypothetical protein
MKITLMLKKKTDQYGTFYKSITMQYDQQKSYGELKFLKMCCTAEPY